MNKSSTGDNLPRDLSGTVQSVALTRNVSTKTVRRWITDGLIYAERVGPRLIRIDVNSLDNIGRPLQYVAPGEVNDR